HREAVQLRQHAVDDEHVVAAVKAERKPLLAVDRVIGHMADLAKRLNEIVGRVTIILDDEQAHGSYQMGAGHARISRGCVAHSSLHWCRFHWSAYIARSPPPPLGQGGKRGSTKGAGGPPRRSSTIDPGGGDGCRALWSLFLREGTGRSPSPT